MLELAIGITEVLINGGFITVDSLLRMNSVIAALLGIELYLGRNIIVAAKQAAAPPERHWQERKAGSGPIVALPAD
ncbi:MAG: hypothetical protein ACREA4_10040 [Nitrososphaera sp.]